MNEQTLKSEPVTASARNNNIDTLRGVAVLGILFMNIYGFAMSVAAYQNPLAFGGTEWYNLGVWFFTHIIFDQKFMAIFSMLFGAGLVLMATRADERGAKYGGNWYRRNFWLLIIGAMHGYFIWFGDILFHYALIGMLIYPLRNRSPKALIIIASILLSLGMALMKLGIISGQRSRAFYRKTMLIGYGFGLPLVIFSAWNLQLHEWEFMWLFKVGGIPNYIGSILMAFGHIALVMTICNTDKLKNVRRRLAAVGRMAFTNYLLHSIILTTVFYGYGLGFYSQVDRIWQMLIVILVLAFQLWMSPIWLNKYRFGPAEWVWRSLTYWRLQDMRR